MFYFFLIEFKIQFLSGKKYYFKNNTITFALNCSYKYLYLQKY